MRWPLSSPWSSDAFPARAPEAVDQADRPASRPTSRPSWSASSASEAEADEVKVCFSSVGRMDDPIYQIVEMPAVPRIGDDIHFEDEDNEYKIHRITWTPLEPEYDAYVVLR